MPSQGDREPIPLPPSPIDDIGESAKAYRRSRRDESDFRPRARRLDQEDAEADFHIRDYLRILSRRRWTAGTAFAIVMSLVIVQLLTAARIYQATARVLIEAEKQNIVSFKEVVEQSQTT